MKYLKKLSLTTWILIAFALGIALGACFINNPAFITTYIRPWGTLYMNLIRFIVVPVVLLSIISGIISLKDIRRIGSIGYKTVLLFLGTTAIAIIVGLLVIGVFRGSFGMLSTADLSYEAAETPSFIDTIVNMFPSNAVAPLLNASMLQLVAIAIFVGCGIIAAGDKGLKAAEISESLNEVFMKITGFIIKLSPIGVFCLIAPVIAENGAGILGSLALVLLVLYISFILHIAIVYMPLAKFGGKISPFKFLKVMAPAMMLAFSSASSMGTLPLTMECTEKLGVRKNIYSFTLPLGVTINMDGSALYQAVAAVFIAACYGIDLSLGQMITIVLVATISSIGAAGVPGAGMIMLAMVLTSVGLPVEGIAIIAGIDRLFDMGRTTLNVMGDAVCSTVVSQMESKKEAKKAA